MLIQQQIGLIYSKPFYCAHTDKYRAAQNAYLICKTFDILYIYYNDTIYLGKSDNAHFLFYIF